jgi:NADH-quinone oxidoreductase subunit L
MNLVDQLYHLLHLDRVLCERTLFLIPLFPFLGFLLNGLFGSKMEKKTAGWVGTFAALASFIWAFLCVSSLSVPGSGNEGVRNALHTVYGTWLSAGDFNCSFGLLLDQLSSVMILIVTGVGTLIHIYSLGYMAHDQGIARFFAYLNLFLFAMILLVLGDNLIMLFVGWEGVGLCSYLLIGFWYEEGKNAAAGMKAFVVNRIGDLGFLLGIFTLIAVFGTVNFVAAPTEEGAVKITKATHILSEEDRKEKAVGFVEVPEHPGLLDYADALRLMRHSSNEAEGRLEPLGFKAPATVSNFDLSHTQGSLVFPGWVIGSALTLACLLLFVGATGKSAQIPLFVWLPDAMAGPTPVSALIHAATMVTSGIYMICRLHGLFSFAPDALFVIAVVGASTAVFSALIGLTQLDIKKVLAYSTVSQLGYMFLGLGVGSFSLGIFHVMTHAFFKALLFLGAGSVIHAMSGEQDMRLMGGLRKKLPWTFATMLVGALALAGIWPFAGWWSKDAIIAETLIKYYDTHNWVWLLLYVFACVGAFCTAFYTFRLMIVTFFGENRASDEVKHHIHESPPSMILPLVVLACLSAIGGALWSGMFTGAGAEVHLGIRNLEPTSSAMTEEVIHHIHQTNLILTSLIAFAGIALAVFMYGLKGTVPNPEAAKANPLYRLSFNKFYVDEIYDWTIIKPFTIISELAHWILDVLLIDGIATGSGYMVAILAGGLRRIQTGLLNFYAFAIMSGAVAVLLYLLIRIHQ